MNNYTNFVHPSIHPQMFEIILKY